MEEGSDDGMAFADFNSATLKASNEGYRVGKAKEEERLMQDGYDEGFAEGMRLGRACGVLFAHVKHELRATRSPEVERLRKIFFEDIPERSIPKEDIVKNIMNIISSSIPTLTSQAFDFCNELLLSD